MHAEELPGGGSRLIYVVGPSGAGKDSVLLQWRSMLSTQAPLGFVQRVITRPASADSLAEQHEPVDDTQMDRLHADGRLALYWRANGLRYGVRRSSLAPLDRGDWLVVNGSRAYLPELRRLAPRAKVVLVTADPQTLAARLADRGREAPGQIEQRLRRAQQLGEHVPADLIVRNEGRLEAAADRLHAWWQALAGSKLTATGLRR